jgi:hypothetical protein
MGCELVKKKHDLRIGTQNGQLSQDNEWIFRDINSRQTGNTIGG